MPGAGSARAAGFLAKIAPKDGTVIAGIMPGAIMGPLLEEKAEILFDPTKVQYLGTANNGSARLRELGRVRDQDLRRRAQRRSMPFGAVSPNESTHDYAYMLQRTAGAKYKVVSGYNGTTQIGLAMERGEVDGSCGWDWASVKAQRADWLRDKKVNVILQIGLERNDELTKMGVPHVWDYREERGRPQDRRAGHRPAGVPALLHRAAGNSGRAACPSCAPRSTRP